MIKECAKVRIDSDATNENILSIAKEKGFTLSQYNKAIKEMSAKYRSVAGRKRLYEVDKYVIISQILHTRLDDLFVVVKEHNSVEGKIV